MQYFIQCGHALDGFDSSKHSGVIAHFTKAFLKKEKNAKLFVAAVTDYLKEVDLE